MIKKVKDLQRNIRGQDGANGCGRAVGARPPHPMTGPDTTPNPYPNGQKPDKTDIRLGLRAGVGLMQSAVRGQSGGLCLFWLSSINVSLKAFNSRCIDVHVKPDQGPVWRVTFVYGEPRKENRRHFWDFLRFMRAQ